MLWICSHTFLPVFNMTNEIVLWELSNVQPPTTMVWPAVGIDKSASLVAMVSFAACIPVFGKMSY